MHAALRQCVWPFRLVCSKPAILLRRPIANRSGRFFATCRLRYSNPNLWHPEEIASSLFSIKAPDSRDPQPWIDALEPFLPGSIRRQESLSSALPAPAIARDFSYFLISAHTDAEIDLLWHLGPVQGRWDVVSYIVKTLAEQWTPFGKLADRIHTASGINWPKEKLGDITCTPIELDNGPGTAFTDFENLDIATGRDGDQRWMERRFQQAAFGLIWQMLGNVILLASSSSGEESKELMSHVLEILAMLHHHDIIPGSIYNTPSTNDSSILQQPPTLHILSSRILTALSDAAWNAHISSAVAAARKANPSTANGSFEVPGSRHKVFVGQLGHEVWLELVLWACLHGGWVIDGANILQKMQETKDGQSWSLLCWKDVFDLNADSTSPIDWIRIKRDADRERSMPEPESRRIVERTISAEVVAAYVDGLVNVIRLGVGERGVYPSVVVNHVTGLKRLLDKHNMGLGFTTWENISVRFEESSGIELENDPGLMLEVLSLSQPYGKELEAVNIEPKTVVPVPEYIFDPTAASLGLLHRVIKSYIDLTDIDGALSALSAAQLFTDLNKRRSLEAFFRDLQDPNIRSQLEPPSMFFSKTPTEKYPAFFPQLPITVLCGLLELLANARLFEIGDRLLYSQDIDGPIIPKELYAEPAVATSLIRYGTATSRKSLLELVLRRVSDRREQLGLPNLVLRGFLECQIQRRQWKSVANILTFIHRSPNHTWHTQAIALFAHEMMLLQRDIRSFSRSSDRESLSQATSLFRNLVQTAYGMPYSRFDPLLELHSILGILSSINDSWAQFCAPLSRCAGSKPLHILTSSFELILDGAIAAFGLPTGKRLWDTWCREIPAKPFHTLPWIAGGVKKMPSSRPVAAERMVRTENRVVLEGLPTGTWEFRGKVRPKLSTVRVVLRPIMAGEGLDMDIVDESGVNVMEWAMGMLRALTEDEQTVERELQRVRMGLRCGVSEKAGSGS